MTRKYKYEIHSAKKNIDIEMLIQNLNEVLMEFGFATKKLEKDSGISFSYRPKYVWHRKNLFTEAFRPLKKGTIEIKLSDNLITFEYYINHKFRFVMSVLVWIIGIIALSVFDKYELIKETIIVTIIVGIVFLI